MGSIKGALKGLVKVTGGILQFLGHLFSSLAGSNPFFAIGVIIALTGGVIFAVVSINTYQNRMINAVINLHDFSVPDSFDYVEKLTIIDDKSAIYASADDYNKRVLELIHWGDKKVTDEKELTDDEKEELDNLEKDQDAIDKGLNGNSSSSDKIDGVKAALNNGRLQEAETMLYLVVKDIQADKSESNDFYYKNGGKDILKKLKEVVEEKKDNLKPEDRKVVVNFLIDFYLHSDNKGGFANGETVTDITKDGWNAIRQIVKTEADEAGLPTEWKVNDELKKIERLKYDKEIEVKNTEKPSDNDKEKPGNENTETQYKITEDVMFTLSTGGQNVLMQQSGKGIWHDDGDKKLWYQTRNKRDDNDENYYVKTKEGENYIYFIKTSFPDNNSFDYKYYQFDTNGYVTKWGSMINELEDY